MREDRLEKLALYLLHQVPREHFDIGVWGTPGFEAHDCGTAACALGWATVCFPGEGLRMRYDEAGRSGAVCFEGETGFDAASRFFEIPFAHAAVLLSVPGDLEEVARRLSDYIDDPESALRRLKERAGPPA